MSVKTKEAVRLKRRRRVRAKVRGTAERPRISVFRSNRGIFAQLIDDSAGRTLAAVAWTEEPLRSLSRAEQSTEAGKLLDTRRRLRHAHCLRELLDRVGRDRLVEAERRREAEGVHRPVG